MLNNFLKFFSFIVPGWIHDVRRYVVICCFTAIFIVFGNGFVEFVFASDKTSEFGGEAVYSRYGIVEPMETGFVPMLADGVEPSEFIYNCGTEFGRGFLNFGEVYIFLDSINGKAMFYEKPDKISEDSTEKSERSISYIFKQLFHDPPFMFALGGIVGSLSLGLLFLFTQQVVDGIYISINCL
jgi:hypothetical protein